MSGREIAKVEERKRKKKKEIAEEKDKKRFSHFVQAAFHAS